MSLLIRLRFGLWSAFLVAFLFALVDGGTFVARVGRLPHGMLPVAVLFVYGAFALAVGGAVGIAGGLLGTSKSRVSAIAGGALGGLCLLSGAYLRWLPEAVRVATPRGLGVLVAIGLGSVLLGAMVAAGRRFVGPRRLCGLWGGATLGAVAYLVGSSGGATLSSPDAPVGPDVYLLVLDTLRADRLGVYGGEPGLTPRLDELAADGVTFLGSISVSNHTPPPHASLLTGTYPSRHGVRDRERKFSLENVTLAERLREAGWATMAVVANVQLQGFLGWAQGFDRYDDGLVSMYGVLDWFSESLPVALLSRAGLPVERWGLGAAIQVGVFSRPTAANVVDRCLESMDGAGSGSIFAMLNFMDPHYPYEPPMEVGASPVEPAARTNGRLRRALGPQHRLEGEIDHELVKRIGELYDGAVHYLDREIGRFLDGLEARGRLGGSIVIVTSDHGEHLGEYGYMLHANTMYRELLDVPLVIRLPEAWPEAHRGRLDSAPVASVDLVPTVLDLLDLGENVDDGAGRPLHGKSLAARLEGQGPVSEAGVRFADGQGRQVVAWGTHRALFRDGALVRVTRAGGDQMADLSSADPGLADVALGHFSDLVLGLEAEGPIAGGGGGIDEALERKLRALGYVE